jgi:acetate---CoA ligase (ADP-forming)
VISDNDLAGALFAPQSVALIGASDDLSKNASRPQRYLARHGFAGQVYPINPKRSDVQGLRAYPSVGGVAGDIDHAYIMVPAAAIPRVITECCAKNIKVATIFSDGFAETGTAGRVLQEEIVKTARAGGLRLLGPNSMGIINTHARLTLSVNAVLELEKMPTGNIGLVSQSGTILGTLLSRGAARGIGFSKLVSLGNESDLSVAEICNLLIDDPETSSIVLFLEGLRDAAALGRVARRAFDHGKPVIVYKLGRSEAGRQLAVSHSGALAGPDRCVQAFFDHHGIIRVDMLENLFECPALVSGKSPVAGNRVAVVTTTGGGAATVADRLGESGLELVGPTDALRKKLSEHGLEIGQGPLVDLTMAGTRDGIYGAALDELLNSPDCDAVVAVVGSSGQFHPDLAVSPIINAGKTGKFLAAFIAPQADVSLSRLAEAGVAAFRTPEACADAVYAALNWRKPTIQPTADQPIEKIEVLLSSSHQLNEFQAGQVFAEIGIPQPLSWVIDDPDGDDLTDITYPVAVKVLSADIAHKTEVDGVRLSIENKDALRRACREIARTVKFHAPETTVSDFLVQSMERGIADVLMAYRVDQEIGPVVVLGAGGVLAEIYDDIAIRPAPISLETALDMIRDVRGLAVIRGYRSQKPGDIAALADALVKLSGFASISAVEVLEAEINPLIVKEAGQGIVAVDGLIVCSAKEENMS